MERKCIRCNIKIMDNAVECPLCHGVLEIEHEDDASKEKKVPGTGTLVSGVDEDIEEGGSKSVTYPDVTYELCSLLQGLQYLQLLWLRLPFL